MDINFNTLNFNNTESLDILKAAKHGEYIVIETENHEYAIIDSNILKKIPNHDFHYLANLLKEKNIKVLNTNEIDILLKQKISSVTNNIIPQLEQTSHNTNQETIHRIGDNIYKGNLKDGKPEGQGQLTDQEGNLKEKGMFRNGLLVHGEKHIEDGNILKGFFDIEGRLQGKGEIVQGDRFEKGFFINGNLVSGQMGMKTHDGTMYQGHFENGRLEGKGIVFRGANIVEEGIFENGVLVEGTYLHENGNRYVGKFNESGDFRAGKVIGPSGQIISEGLYKNYELVLSTTYEHFSKKILRLYNPQHNFPIAKNMLNEIIQTDLKGFTEFKGIHKKIIENQDEQGLSYYHFFSRVNDAVDALKRAKKSPLPGITTKREIAGLTRIIQHRSNYFEYAKDLSNCAEVDNCNSMIEKIQRDIDLLDNPDSSRVVTLEDGTTSFSIPGGWEGHHISYEFQKKDNEYFFVIHNRGQLATDTRLHGPVAITHPNGKVYGKTIIPIKVSKEALQDEAFIKKLIEAKLHSYLRTDFNFAYDYIFQHLFLSNDGEIQKTEVEKQLESLQNMLMNPFLSKKTKELIRKQAVDLMDLDPHFNSFQTIGSCVESNSITLEYQMASPITRWQLKYRTLCQRINSLQTTLPSGSSQEDREVVINYANKQQKKLEEKLRKESGRISVARAQKLSELVVVTLQNSQNEIDVKMSQLTETLAKDAFNSIIVFFPSDLIGTFTQGTNLSNIEAAIKRAKPLLDAMKKKGLEKMDEYEKLLKRVNTCEEMLSIHQTVSYPVKEERMFRRDLLYQFHNLYLNSKNETLTNTNLEVISEIIKAAAESRIPPSRFLWRLIRNECILAETILIPKQPTQVESTQLESIKNKLNELKQYALEHFESNR